MTEAQIRGWCPGALRPMASGDGLIVRIRPRAGVLSAAQAKGIALAAQAHGNGMLDLTGRGNLQLRGVTEQSHPALLEAIDALDLLDHDIRSEAQRNIVITPFWHADDGTGALALRLEHALEDVHQLPAKFGFAIDIGRERVLAGVSADIRLERTAQGDLMIRADGADCGTAVSMEEAVPGMIALAQWFLSSGASQTGRGRMAKHIASGHRPGDATQAPAPCAPPAKPGLCEQGALVGFAFGQIQATTLLALATLGPIRMTPWRMLLVEGIRTMPDLPDLITCADDPLRAVTACTGAPGCPQAAGETRALARALAPFVPEGAHLHVSGCVKGCAHPLATPLTLVATAMGFDLVCHGNAQAKPHRHGLSAHALLAKPDLLTGAL